MIELWPDLRVPHFGTRPMKRIAPFLLYAALPWAAMAQSTAPAPRMAAPSPPPPPLGALQGGWDNQAAATNAVQWQQANSRMPADAGVQWNWFRSEEAAMRSSNNGELRPQDRQELANIAEAIKATAPNSFEYYMAEYFLAFPAPSAFNVLEAARALEPGRTELLPPLLSKAMLDGDATALGTWSGEMEQRGLVAKGLETAASDLLLSLPPEAVLFTNGDMDTQPVVIRQLQHRDKPEVLVVDRRLLADAHYRQRIWQQAGAGGTAPGNGPAFAAALLGASRRPVYFALGLDRSWLAAFPGKLHAVGAVFRVGRAAPSDAAILAANWKAMKKPLDAGPLSRNYLVPGAMLLAQLRSTGNQAHATALEQELRHMAAATGAEQQLRQLGIILP